MALNARVWARRVFGKDNDHNRMVRQQRLLVKLQDLGFDIVSWTTEQHQERPGGQGRTMRISRIILKD